jgi:hypothetical protein
MTMIMVKVKEKVKDTYSMANKRKKIGKANYKRNSIVVANREKKNKIFLSRKGKKYHC